MYNRCCIENCASIRKDVKLHGFPTSEKGLEKWLKCIGSVQLSSLSHDVLRKKMFVCHKHFEKRFITEGNRVCVGSYPSLFSECEIVNGSPSDPSAYVDNEVDILTTKTDHCYTKKMHEDHTYSKSVAMAPPGTVLPHVLKEIENVPQMNKSAMAPSGTVLPHVLKEIGNLPQMNKSDLAENPPASSDILTQIESHESVKDLAENQPGPSHPLTQVEESPAVLQVPRETNVQLEECVTNVSTPRRKKGTRKRLILKFKNLSPTCQKMYKEYVRSKKQASSFIKRAKRAIKFAKSDSFSNLTRNMNPLAKTIFWMQIKQCMKKLKGRRFTMEEKIIALSIMKQSPKCYRFLQRIFILPSRNTLTKMISSLKINPGINPQIFETIKQEVSTWTETKKYCSVIFDEVSLETGLSFDKGRDSINGFVELEAKTDQFADHALAFMIRGAVHKWQQPIAYYFCEGATKMEQLKVILKIIVAAVVDTGLMPVALICDQGTSFRSALNSLAEDTRREQIKAGENTDDGIISLSGHNLSVIYDPPHLIKGIRNNFLSKNIVYDGKVSTWNDIVDVYKTDCNHAEARLLHKLNDRHVLPNNIDKMKVKYCTRVLSKTVAAALSYTSQFAQYSDGREVSHTIKNTAETVSFFDDLFDSCNGAALKTRGKNLRKAVTKKSAHHAFWQEAIKKVDKMKFVHKESGQTTQTSVPSLKNWKVTLKSFQRLWKFFDSKGIKIMRTRYFNSDPIEIFFGQVRAYNFRNNDPDCNTFTQTFRSLLITRFIKFHSSNFNCEEDSGRQIIKIKNLFEETVVPETERQVVLTQNLQDEIMSQETIQLLARRERLHVHSRAYTAGWLVGKILNKINCEPCRQDLTTEEGCIHRWISHREDEMAKKKLNYPSEHAVRYFGNIVKATNEYLEKEPHQNNISTNIKNLVLTRYSLDFLKCRAHQKIAAECFALLTIRFTIFNWCNTINKILKGRDVMRLQSKLNLPRMQQKAFNKYKKTMKNKKSNK